MDPCPFVRVIVESLALKPSSVNSGGGIHSSTTPCFCKININDFPSQTVILPLTSSSSDTTPEITTSAPGFHLDSSSIRRLSAKPLTLTISVYNSTMDRMCGFTSPKLLDRVTITITDLTSSVSQCRTFHKGWVHVGKNRNKVGDEADKGSTMIHLVVRSEPDPRFVFQFDGEPECSPVVFQIQENNIRQPVFSCKFSADRNYRLRSFPSDFTNNESRWKKSFTCIRERQGRERKGWMIMVHDLSGSPVAAASMVTPFVPSHGSDRVSRSNPGAWLILRPNGATVSSWKPWGRLEAWRERGPVDGLGYKFELVTEINIGIPIAEATLSVKKGGQFCIDYQVMKDSGLGSRLPGKGFVMGSSVEGEGKVSKPIVQVGAHHVTCMADAALFIALSAAIDLSMDACQLFSHKLRKELCHDEDKDSSYS
ncbi:hypothetical protein TanjilG_30251 [Lupinus angustifolius]|uniref:DUF1005 domain-containing protein n=1 Tax=Lupinus angustifolius TaxID=3871 RepID=A0A4P1R6Y8_LUPAN|nr:PREDICTED: uncharacterized protein LOC109358413 [Lupinus angustifolius]OIW03975.1 hypothetical protein TanjilG_30251 [Lupinus angustifolius]